MAVIQNVQLFWLNCNPEKPRRFQNKASAPATWSLQFRVADKKTADSYAKDFGFRFTPVEDDGKIVYRTSISAYAFAAGPDGEEDPNRPNRPIRVIGADGRDIDPDTVGNGSIGNISFYVRDDKSSRSLRGVQVTTWKVFKPRDAEDEFDTSGEMTIIEDNTAEEDSVDDLF